MKNYLCLLLIALIACESTNKDNEIVLKASDFINNLFEELSQILSDCDWESECVSNKVYTLFANFTGDETMDWLEFISSSECHDLCYDKISAKNDAEWSEMYCSNLCSAY